MTLDIFDPDKSDRALKLYNIIKIYIKPTSSILDIGCGTAPMLGYLVKVYPDINYFGFDHDGVRIGRLQKDYPKQTFKRIVYDEGDISFIKQKYDIIIHTGIDSWQLSPIWGIHGAMLSQMHLRPDIALLETGYNIGYTLPHESYCFVCNTYYAHSYKKLDKGEFMFDVGGHRLRERRWTLFGRKE